MPPPIDPLDRASIPRDLKGDTLVEALSSPNTNTKLNQLVNGQKVQGQVLAKLIDQSFLVDVADTQVKITLPAETPIGAKLNLSFVSLFPRPTFLLEQTNAPPSAVNTSPAASQLIQSKLLGSGSVEENPHFEKGNLSNQETAASLTVAAKLIAGYLQANIPAIDLSKLLQREPIAQTEEDFSDAPQIAKQLQSAIKSSGLFYESHVAQWANRQLDIDHLKNEPQALLNKQNLQYANDAASNPTHALDQLVQQQLNVLDQQTLHWHGELLPEVPLEWKISRQKEKNAKANESLPEKQTWQTTVKFSLPNLGQITATIYLVDDQLQFSVHGQSEEIVQLLRNNSATFNEALHSAGAQLSGFKVDIDEKI